MHRYCGMSMTKEQAHKVVEMIQDDGYEASVREEYSGRGMYSEVCVGVVSKSPILVGYYCGIMNLSFEEVPTRMDSMGLSTIVY